ncbi:MAG: nuclear transport factor 2 family protein [Phycisphaerales bacterium]|nr:nuclear transport factor 2 family protein [Phycisphaerales bacterium]
MAKKNKAPKAGKNEKKDKKARKADKSLAPKPVKIGKGAKPGEIAQAVVAHVRAMKPDAELWKQHWSKKCESIEGAGVEMVWKGLKSIDAKCRAWMDAHEIHSATADGPYVGATGFAVKYTMDVTEKASGKRHSMSEVAVYTVEKGKVVREEFMYAAG